MKMKFYEIMKKEGSKRIPTGIVFEKPEDAMLYLKHYIPKSKQGLFSIKGYEKDYFRSIDELEKGVTIAGLHRKFTDFQLNLKDGLLSDSVNGRPAISFDSLSTLTMWQLLKNYKDGKTNFANFNFSLTNDQYLQISAVYRNIDKVINLLDYKEAMGDKLSDGEIERLNEIYDEMSKKMTLEEAGSLDFEDDFESFND